MSGRLHEYFETVIAHEAFLWDAVDARLAHAGAVRAGRLVYLRTVASIPMPRVQDIADRLGITVGAASRFTDRMVADGRVARVPHPTDRRSSCLELTSTGAGALEDSEAALDDALRDLLGGIDADELADLTRSLRRATQMIKRWDKIGGTPGGASTTRTPESVQQRVDSPHTAETEELCTTKEKHHAGHRSRRSVSKHTTPDRATRA